MMSSSHYRTCLTGVATAIAMAVSAFPNTATAAPVTDLANDFLSGFTGTKNGDLDILSTFAIFDGSVFHVGGTMNGPIGTTNPSLYVFGFNRGVGTAGFAAVGETNVLFDAVVTMTGTGVTAGRLTLPTPATTFTLPAGAARIAGSTFEIDIPVADLPSNGLAPAQYGINLWTRDQSQTGNAALADFAPNNATFVASAPEPLSLVVLAVGLIGLGVVRGRVR